MTGEGILIQRMLYLFSQTVERFTHIGNAGNQPGYRARFYSAGELLQELRKARAQLKVNELLLKLERYRVIVVDDLGYVKRDNAETGVLFELIAHRYERGSLVITSNHPFSTWGSIFVDETMSTPRCLTVICISRDLI